eukprot:TRINITY_DN2052_c0_g1_i1.p1 TRINITY_DN2052_c0_g1~~TRINITY_DN2052_c0_g1_i1.p1  ORF type:complete len:366 (+),score=56.65 TRINITY_DN2052_c0_g1_i1:78-1175(+)
MATYPPRRNDKYTYLTGFGNEFATEARPGTLPQGQNSPQICPEGLYAEQLSGSPFTAPRPNIKRSWLYRTLPSVLHTPFEKIDNGLLTRSFEGLEPFPQQTRWQPMDREAFLEGKSIDFSQGLITQCGAGSPSMKAGLAIHWYCFNTNMTDKAMYNSDGEMLIVPQQGGLDIETEMGFLSVEPGEIVVIPRGIYFSISLLGGGTAGGYICEVYEGNYSLPPLGVIGSNCLAYPRDFLSPVAAYRCGTEDVPFTIVNKFQNQLFECKKNSSPFNVVAWHGNYAPYKYDLDRFCTLNTVSFDHPDPSIFCVLTAQTAVAGTAVCDFVIFPSRWMVAEHTFRPPWYHRNCMSEYMGLLRGVYDAKPTG